MTINAVWQEILAPKFAAPTVLVVVEGDTIICWPNPVPVSKDKSYVVIDFLLCANETGAFVYSFPETGAVILTDASSQFPMSSWTDSGKKVAKLFNFNNDASMYHYNIYVDKHQVKPEGYVFMKTLTLELDPGIRNGDT